jgi:hypothetical protein
MTQPQFLIEGANSGSASYLAPDQRVMYGDHHCELHTSTTAVLFTCALRAMSLPSTKSILKSSDNHHRTSSGNALSEQHMLGRIWDTSLPHAARPPLSMNRSKTKNAQIHQHEGMIWTSHISALTWGPSSVCLSRPLR